MNGDRVAVILDFTCDSNANVERDEKVKEEPAKAPVYWIDGNLIYFICEWVQSIVFNCMQNLIRQLVNILTCEPVLRVPQNSRLLVQCGKIYGGIWLAG